MSGDDDGATPTSDPIPAQPAPSPTLDGMFTIHEMVLALPRGAVASSEDGQTVLAEVRGGFCAQAGSMQGTYDGWTFTPTSEEVTGVWFVAPVEAL